ncbi:hypothetical protein RND71_010523 [Anisodus tanguticus]|uniref:HTH myb-type domain-containing protein n=1 Tax=Anisodus tanguticus TaxID=243964 RepID=A0AAE1VI79_9SOLA|nr:hypothetical protein RND71_010523 [Anisodus tanguticus]
MAPRIVKSKDMSLVLSSDAKPRLKWTPELHQRFVDAVTQLGGADKATPKSLMSVMNIHGLTLYHLKSHLQKYRLAEIQLAQSDHKSREEDKLESAIVHDYQKEDENSRGLKERNNFDAELKEKQSDQMNNLQIARALQMQMEVQRKLHQQIEVQRHLQLRIEAQGKYLHSVLMKAQKELAKAEISQLVPMAKKCCPSSSLSEVTKIDRSISKYTVYGDSPSSSLSALAKIDGSTSQEIGRKQLKVGTVCSVESCLTSFESLGRIKESRAKHRGKEHDLNAEVKERKRSKTNIRDDNWTEQRPSGKIRECNTHRTNEQFTKLEFLETIDLNRKCLDDFDTCPKAIDFFSRCF